MWLLAAAYAHAAEIRLQVGVDGAARSVLAVYRGGAEPVVGACNDAGTGPDAAPGDGRWTCAPTVLDAGTVEVFAIVDGRLFPGGAAAPGELRLRVGTGTATLSPDDAVLDGLPPRAPAGPAGQVLVRLSGANEGGAPVVLLSGPGGPVQLTCGDDGRFPDAVMNDLSPGCAGTWSEPEASVVLQLNGGDRVDLGQVAFVPGLVRFLTVDVATHAVDPTPFALPLPAPAVEAAPAAPAGGGQAPPPQPDAGAPAGAPTPPMGDPVLGAAPWVVSAGALGLAAWALRRRRQRTERGLRGLRRHEAPPWLPGGPGPADPVGALECADPAALLATLAERLAPSRRLVLVLPDGVALPPLDGPGAWHAPVPDCAVVADAIEALASTPGAPVAALVLGAGTLRDPGAVAPDPLLHLSRALPPGGALLVVHAGDTPLPTWVPRWRADGPPWAARRA